MALTITLTNKLVDEIKNALSHARTSASGLRGDALRKKNVENEQYWLNEKHRFDSATNLFYCIVRRAEGRRKREKKKRSRP